MIKNKVTVLHKEFFAFIKEHNISGLAIAFVMGVASNSLVKSFVDNIVMPFVVPLTNTRWEEATLNIGPVMLKWGAFLSEFLHFFILALIVFLIGGKLLKQELKKK